MTLKTLAIKSLQTLKKQPKIIKHHFLASKLLVLVFNIQIQHYKIVGMRLQAAAATTAAS